MEIVSFFGNIKKANEAVGKLNEFGCKVYVDSNSHYDEDTNMKTDIPGTETAPTLSGLVINSGEGPAILDQSKGSLMAAMPDVSGMAGFEEIASISCKVIVEDNGKDKNKIENIITKYGGTLDNPNVDLPEAPMIYYKIDRCSFL